MSKVIPVKFVSIHASYNQLEIALFRNQECVDSIINTDTRASSSLIPMLDSLLKKHKLLLPDLSFIAVDKGPGAFTSLRVTIATVNGIAFDNKMPLVGISGLEALSQQAMESHHKAGLIVTLLNAYNNDAYFLVTQKESKNMGCQNIDILLDDLKKVAENLPILFCGQGSQLYKPKIQHLFSDQAMIIDDQLFAPAQTIGLMAYDNWIKKENIENQITPLYLKTQLFAVRK